MKWTSEKPTKPGHYWWRQEQGDPEVVFVEKGGFSLWWSRWGMEGASRVERALPTCQWAGPIEEPTE